MEVDRLRAEGELASAQARLTEAQSRRGHPTAPPPTKRACLNAPTLRNRFNVSYQMLQRVLVRLRITGDCEPVLLKRVYAVVHQWVAQYRTERRLDVLIKIVEADVYAVYAWPKGRLRGFEDVITQDLWTHLEAEMLLPVNNEAATAPTQSVPPHPSAHRSQPLPRLRHTPRFTAASWQAYCRQADTRSDLVLKQIEERAHRSQEQRDAEEQRRNKAEIQALMR